MSTAGQVSGALPSDQINQLRAAETRFPWMMTIYVVLHVTALVFVALRVYVRTAMVKQFATDDAFIVAAGLIGLGGGLVVLIVMGTEGGLGRHIDTLSQTQITTFFKMNFIQLVSSTLTGIMFVKISVGFSLLRLIRTGWYAWVVWATMAFVVAYTIMAIFSAFLYCTPLAGFWDRGIVSTCFNKNLWIFFAYFNSSSNVVTDFIFSTLPIPIIWTLQLKRKLRIYLICVMALGYLACACGIAKAACQTIFRSNPDQTYNNFISFFGFVELNIGIIAACVPTLRPLFGAMLGIKSSADGNSAYPQRSRMPPSTHGIPKGTSGYVKTDSATEYEMSSTHSRKFEEDLEAQYSSTAKGAVDNKKRVRVSTYPTKGSDSSSEEFILHTDIDRSGIMKSTEILVSRGN